MGTGFLVAIIVILWGMLGVFDKKMVTHVHPIAAQIYLSIIAFLLIPAYYFLGKVLKGSG